METKKDCLKKTPEKLLNRKESKSKPVNNKKIWQYMIHGDGQSNKDPATTGENLNTEGEEILESAVVRDEPDQEGSSISTHTRSVESPVRGHPMSTKGRKSSIVVRKTPRKEDVPLIKLFTSKTYFKNISNRKLHKTSLHFT